MRRIAILSMSLFLVTTGVVHADTMTLNVWYEPQPTQPDTAAQEVFFSSSIVTSMIDIMDYATRDDSRFEYNYTEHEDWGKRIHAIGGVWEDIPNQLSWLLYKLNGEASIDTPPRCEELSEVGAEEIIVADGEHYLWWRTDWTDCYP